jgi:glycine dehydrogenase subunit 1
MNTFAYLPHTPEDVARMLGVIGVESLEDLFSDIPPSLRASGVPDIPQGLCETGVYREFERLRNAGRTCVSFLGAGCYDHLVPSIVPFVTGRTEFATSYTPYQAEASQGMLQAIYEYQTMITLLAGLPVSNASLYDGATAAAEACAMARGARKGARVIGVSPLVHPHALEVLETFFSDSGAEIARLPESEGATDWSGLARIEGKELACLLVQSPNRYGIVEDLTGLAARLGKTGALLIVSANPMSLGVLKSPGEWGADIAVGDGQPFGLGQNFGGPGVGYIAAGKGLMRLMPGRIVGETVDSEGARAFVLTLQAREQHIRRERATSNICTNQALAALAVAAYLTVVGREGVRRIAGQNVHKARYLAGRIAAETPARIAYDKPYFNEFVLDLPCPARKAADALLGEGVLAGVPLDEFGGGDPNRLLVAVTEKRTRAEMDRYVELIRKAIS